MKHFYRLAMGFIFVGWAKIALAVEDLKNPFGNKIIGEDLRDPEIIVGAVLKVVLSVVGIAGVVALIYAGVLWMAGGGKEENIQKAKRIIIWSVVGLVIILGSYALVDFLFSGLLTTTTK